MKNSSGIGGLGNLSVTSQFPQRPGHGTQGRKIVVHANYFKVDVASNVNLTRYNVEITPELTPKKKIARLFQMLLELPEFAGVATEYKSMIVARQPLSIPNDYSVQITYREAGEEEPGPRAVTYTLRVVTPLSMAVSDLVSYLRSSTPGIFPQQLEIIQVINVLFGHHPQTDPGTVSASNNRHYSLDRSDQNRRNIQVLKGGLESLRGYFQSARAATGGLLLNVNVTHGVFLEPLRLDELFGKMGSGNKPGLSKKIKGVRVRVIHIPGKKNKKTNQETPRIKGIAALAHPLDGRRENGQHVAQVSKLGGGPKDVKFLVEDVPPGQPTGKNAPKKPSGAGRYVSVYDYFKGRYPNIALNTATSIVNVGNRDNPSYLPAEVCIVLPGQAIDRRLSPEQTQEMIKFACRKPAENGASIIGNGKPVLGLNPNPNSVLVRLSSLYISGPRDNLLT